VLSVGSKVQSKHDPSRVGINEAIGPLHAGIQWYAVFYGGAQGTQTVAEMDLQPYEPGLTPLQQLVRGHLGGHDAFQRMLTFQRLVRDQPLTNNIYAFNASRTRFFPYQFKPLMKLLDSPRHRILVCDEVGLGKTIEAGLILMELKARQTMQRVLVVCPSNLKAKWRMELRNRFGEDFRILTAPDFRQFLDEYEATPTRADLNGIVSLETIRSDAMLDRLEELAPPFDLVIVDEAHHMRNFGRNQRRAGALLGQSAGAMVLLTATPVHLGNSNLFSLLNILDDEDFPDEASAQLRFTQNEPLVLAQTLVGHFPPRIVEALAQLKRASGSPWLTGNPLYPDVLERLDGLARDPSLVSRTSLLNLQRDLSSLNLLGHIFTRTRKREVHAEGAKRRSHAVVVTFSPREQLFYDAVSDLVRLEGEAKGHPSVIQQWRLNMPQRRMASSLQAMVEHYRSSAAWEGDDVPEELPLEPAEDLEPTTLAQARTRLDAVLKGWPKDGTDSKYEQLQDILRRIEVEEPGAKAIVFGTFVGTLEYLARRLRADGLDVRLITGRTPADDRPDLIAAFRDDPKVRVLLSSRVGSEGLDFQFCHTVVNYDLPWNPMEVEQRIGRLDRIGQESPVINVFNLWVVGTIEERILKRLYERIGIFERSIGQLEEILGDVIQRLEQEVLSKKLTPTEEAERVEQVALAVEKKVREIEALESDAARFVGTDAYFEQEVDSIRERRRYVTGPQLRRFVEDFLLTRTPRSRLEYDESRQIGRLMPDQLLKTFIRDRRKSHELTDYLAAGDQGVELTFDSETAFRHPQVDFVNVLHPLVGAIVEAYEEEQAHLSAAQHVVLETDRMSQGYYFFLVYRLRVRAAREATTLEAVFVREDGAEACDAAVGEILLGEMIERGRNPTSQIEYDPAAAEHASQAGYELFLERERRLRAETDRTNLAFVDRRLASLRTSYLKSIQKQRALLARAEAARRQERYLRLLRGLIVRLEGELAAQEADIIALRSVEVAHDAVLAGILEVV